MTGKEGDFDVSIIIPAYNEDLTIGQVISEIKKSSWYKELKYQIIVVDDGSIDLTRDTAKVAGADFLISYSVPRGIRNAIVHGAIKSIAPIIVFLDADGQVPSSYIPNLVTPILYGDADVVVGYRESAVTSTSKHRGRFYSSKLWQVLSRILFRKSVKDIGSWFRAYNRDIFLKLANEQKIHQGYDSIFELTVLTLKSNVKLREVPILTRLIRERRTYVRVRIGTTLFWNLRLVGIMIRHYMRG